MPSLSTAPRAAGLAGAVWLAVLAAVVAGLVASIPLAEPPLDDVLAALVGPRTIEGRLTSAPYAPLLAPLRAGAPRPQPHWRVLAEAGRAQERAGRSPTSGNLQAFGIAALVAGHLDEAVQALEDAAVVEPANAAVQSDLSAAYLARAALPGQSIDVPRAVEAAARARRLDGRSPEARFNYALALERLHLRQAAARAWEDVLAEAGDAGDADAPWYDEARGHLARLAAPLAELPPPPSAVADAQLAAWAEVAQHDAALPVPDLSAAGAFHAAMAEAARQASPRDRQAFARLVLTLVHADAAITVGDLVSAGRRIAGLPSDVLSADTAVGLWARRIRLTATFGSSQGRDLHGEAEALLAVAHRRGFEDLEADALHRLGGFEFVSGAYERALARLEAAAALRARRGNARGAMSSRLVAADAYGRLGRVPEAWTAYLQVLASGPVRDDLLDQSRLTSPASLAAAAGMPAVAEVCAREAVTGVRDDAAPAQRATANYVHAGTLVAAGALDEADRALRRAGEAASAMPVSALQDRLRAEIAFVDLQAHAVSDPERALAAARMAERGLVASNTRQRLLSLQVLAARAHRALHDVDAARAALLAGVAIVDQQQGQIARADFLPSFVDASWDVFSELVDLEAAAGHPEAALGWLDRGYDIRRRWLAGAGPVALASVSRSGPLVAYLVRPDALRIWVVVDGVVHQRLVPVPRAALQRAAARLAHVLTLDQAPEALDAAVVAVARDVWWPVAPLLAAGGAAPARVALVLDPVLQRVPFAMLPWSPADVDVVVDRTATTLCPSVAACGAASQPVGAGARAAALHAGQGGSGFAALPAARDEAERIGRRYAGADVAVATEAAFAAALAQDDLVHFSGHAVADERYPGRSELLLATDGGDGVRVPLTRLLAGPVRARLVVLSACRTSRAEARRGSGGTGVAGEFLRAGVLDVVAAQWDVRDDVAGEVMDHVHEALAGGAPSWEAVRLAQQRLRRDAARPARDWAGYVAFTSAPRS